jgi:DNA-binding transcriptional ArsR family regulator
MVVEISNRRPSGPELSRAFKALGDETRVAILELLRARCGPDGCTATETAMQRTVSELAEAFDLALSTVSHHLKELRQAGLITCTRHGQRIHCSVNEEMLESLRDFLKSRTGAVARGPRRKP